MRDGRLVPLLACISLVACSKSGESGGDAGADPDAPQVQSWRASLDQVEEGDSVTFTAVVTDPQGSEDILGGSVVGSGGASYGQLQLVGTGQYELSTDWSAI